MGRYSFMGGVSSTTKDIPPFILQQHRNRVVCINVVGMRRAGFTPKQINAMRRVFHIAYLQELSVPNAMARIEKELGSVDVVQEYVQFVRETKRGINGVRDDEAQEMAAA